SWLTALAVEYQRLFGLEVYPYEALFVDDDLMLNTAATDHVVALYEECGFEATAVRVGAPDHLGLELRLMAELAQAEAKAEAVGDGARRQWARRMQTRCLNEHLARWAPIAALTLARVAREPIYQALATLTAELVASDVGENRKTGEEGRDASPITDHDEPGVGAIVRELLTPARIGVWLCRADIRAIGQQLGLPVPIGERAATLRSLFQAAGEYEQVPALLMALDRIWVEMDERVTALQDQYPSWGNYAAFWHARLAYGRSRLAALRQQAERDGQPNGA
ncbi:MAG: molecular chaperone TorD family protein, partial [Anaerolineae bacterium]|nr:molecular chaperone TorD family protein [Anaerolineae bacterium]